MKECIKCHVRIIGLPWQGKKGIYCNDCWGELEQEREDRKADIFSENSREEYKAFIAWESEYFEQ